MFYIAYGSNLNSKVRKDNDNNFKYVKSLTLNGYKLAFKRFNSINSYLTLDKDINSSVNVVLYKISEKDELILDEYEDVEHYLYYKEYLELEVNGNIEKCLIYLMNEDASLSLPQNEYFTKVIDGYNEYGFNTDALYNAVNEINYSMKDLMTNCYLYLSSRLDINDELKTRGLLDEINNTKYIDFKTREELGRKLFGSVGKNLVFNKPFHCDHGYNVHIGNNFYSNFNLTILDTSRVDIGDNCFIGPNVSIVCPIHPISAEERNTFFEGSRNIKIKDNVWICANVVINGGVTIGENVVVASGSVVTKSLGDNCIIGGNPAKVLRKITEEDKKYYQKQIEISKKLIENIK